MISHAVFRPSQQGTAAVIVCPVTASFVPYAALLLGRIVRLYTGRKLTVHVLAFGCDDGHRLRFTHLASGQKPAVSLVWHRRTLGGQATPCDVFQAVCLERWRFLNDPALDSGLALMLDVDLLVESDLLPLWQTDLGGRMLGAVRDFGFPTHGSRFASADQPERPYFNAGVVLVDIAAWRRRHGLDACLAAWPRAHATGAVFAPDQDAVNLGLPDEWLELDPSWNAQVIALQHHARWAESGFKERLRPRLRELLLHPRIRHWAGSFKPWNRQPGCDIPFQDRYLRLLAADRRRRKFADGWDACRRLLGARRCA